LQTKGGFKGRGRDGCGLLLGTPETGKWWRPAPVADSGGGAKVTSERGWDGVGSKTGKSLGCGLRLASRRIQALSLPSRASSPISAKVSVTSRARLDSRFHEPDRAEPRAGSARFHPLLLGHLGFHPPLRRHHNDQSSSGKGLEVACREARKCRRRRRSGAKWLSLGHGWPFILSHSAQIRKEISHSMPSHDRCPKIND
jgi:hypothetical protein